MDESGKQVKNILVVDDNEINYRILNQLCSQSGYRTIPAMNGKEAVQLAIDEQPDLILMDLMMPVMDGLEATEIIKSDPRTRNIPVVMLTALNDREQRISGISKGVSDFISKPFDPTELTLRIKNNLMIKEYNDFLLNHNRILEIEVNKKTEALETAYQKIQKGYIESIQRLNRAAEFRDKDTGAHISRISHYSRELAQSIGMENGFVDAIFYAAPMHDIGKVGVPDHILLKQGPLNDDEWIIMQAHTTIGAKILAGSESEYLRMGEEIARTHHERWSGNGYPRGLKGDEIPVSGRIINIADQYDALRSKRPYKQPFSHRKAVDILVSGDGRTSPGDFDPVILDAFQRIEKKFEEIWESESD